MKKSCSITCVVSWLAFWTFGFLALSSPADMLELAAVYTAVAFMGMMAGTFTYLKLAREQV